MSEFVIPNVTPFKLLECEKAFKNLNKKEKLYAHYLSKACYYGGLIVLPQTSLESSLIFVLLHKLFKGQPISELKEIAVKQCNFAEDEFCSVLMYTAGIISNLGNYKNFGDTKIIPNLSKEKLRDLVLKSKSAKLEHEMMKYLLSHCLDSMFSLEDKEKQIGFPSVGKTTYLSKNVTQEDSDIVKEFFKKQKLEPVNSRLFKTVDESGASCYEIRLASVLKNDDDEAKEVLSKYTENGQTFLVTRGDYSKLLKILNKYLLLAKDYAANENEVKMIEHYVKSFHTGSINDHIDGSRYWVKDRAPIVETYIGFIETYRDPAGIRAEFQGYVALTSKEMTVKFNNLVQSATDILPLLPWPAEYEKDKFLQPDFTSLDVLAFGSGVTFAGQCTPNYDEIRQNEGFKNVSFGNVISSISSKNLNFLSEKDQELMQNNLVDSFELVVGLHELLGHGSGKLFKKMNDGTFNFDIDNVKHLETNEKISSYYEEGETFDSVFGAIGSPYEECKAECVALYLCFELGILKTFGHEGLKAEQVIHGIWLDMLHKGLQALQFYQPKTDSWLQAHAHARYVILQVCLEAGEDFVHIEQVKGSDGNPDLLLHTDYTKVKTVGKKAIGNFLRKLQLYKSTADIHSAKRLFDKYSAVTSEDKYPFLNYRDIVMARKKPRDVKVQVNTVLENDEVQLIKYESSPEGFIQSFVERFQEHDVDGILLDIWKEDRQHFL